VRRGFPFTSTKGQMEKSALLENPKKFHIGDTVYYPDIPK